MIILEIKFYKGAKRLGGERESGRNDPGAKRFGANGKVGETTQGRTGMWAKRPGFVHIDSRIAVYEISLVTRKPIFGVFDQLRHKPACVATEAS